MAGRTFWLFVKAGVRPRGQRAGGEAIKPAIIFAICRRPLHSLGVTQPLALVVYEKLLPGTQLVNRLQDLKYRARAVTDATTLVACARQDKPLVILVDVFSSRHNIAGILAQLKQTSETQHIPIVAFAGDDAKALQESALAAGANLVVTDAAILNHLPQMLEQALRVE
jgi:PleD family two-component response regulator